MRGRLVVWDGIGRRGTGGRDKSGPYGFVYRGKDVECGAQKCAGAAGGIEYC